MALYNNNVYIKLKYLYVYCTLLTMTSPNFVTLTHLQCCIQITKNKSKIQIKSN